MTTCFHISYLVSESESANLRFWLADSLESEELLEELLSSE